MIFAPPQHGKSELVSVRLPAFWTGKRPNDPVILASYGSDLAHSKSRQARDVVEGQEYRALFGDLGVSEGRIIRTRDDSRAVHKWSLNHPYRGGMMAVGVGGPITGNGGMLGIIDDPIENWAQAQSPTYRNSTWLWWQTTFRTRIWEGGAIILIMTRWHEDDLAGRILKDQPGRWKVLRLPAIAETQDERDANDQFTNQPIGQPDPLGREPGEPLAPKRFSIAALLELRKDVGTMGWAAEYQGAPRAPEGNRFKREWFDGEGRIVPAAPRNAKRIRYWDKAGTEGGGKYTAGVLLAQANGITYIEDVVRGQWSAGNRERVIKETAEGDAERYGDRTSVEIWIEQEPGSGGKESAEATVINLSGFRIKKDLPTGDKDVRLEPFAVQAENGNVRMVRGAWNHAFIEELIAIPNGAFRDQSDATGGGFNKFNKPVNTPQRVQFRGLYKSADERAAVGKRRRR